MSKVEIKIKHRPTHGGGEYMGTGCIAGSGAGIVTVGSEGNKRPASKPVCLFDADTLELLKVRWSNEDGQYVFRCLNVDKHYLVMVRDDNKNGYQPFAWDNITASLDWTLDEQAQFANSVYKQ